MKEYEKYAVQEMNLSNPFTFLILKSAGGRIHKSTGSYGAATIHSGLKKKLVLM